MYNRGMVEILSCSGHVISCWILIGAASMTWQQTYVISYHWLVLSALICLLKQFAHQRYYKNEPCFIEGFLGGKSTFKETFILMHRNEPRIQNLNPIWAYNLIWRLIFPSPFGSILTNGLGAAFNTALGRDCKGRPQGDYFYGCQVRVSRMFLLIMIVSIVCRTLQYWKAQEIRSEYCEQAVYQQQSRWELFTGD